MVARAAYTIASAADASAMPRTHFTLTWIALSHVARSHGGGLLRAAGNLFVPRRTV